MQISRAQKREGKGEVHPRIDHEDPEGSGGTAPLLH